jgi:YQGE family putative transporter
MKLLRNELASFFACPQPMRVLILANMIYASVFSLLEIFLAAFVLRSSHQLERVIVYQLSVYTAAPLAFLLNGLLMERIGAKHLYAAGMALSGLSIVAMMYMGATTLATTVGAGLLIGLATGLFWANRGFLAASSTSDENRNYYYGVEFFIVTLAGVLVPLLIGGLLASTSMYGWMGGSLHHAYLLIAMGALVLTVCSALLVEQGKFARQKSARFLYWSFPHAWWRFLAISLLKGVAQGYSIAAPAMLVLRMVGAEGTLGLTQSIGGVVSALVLYWTGRVAAPHQRSRIYAAGAGLYLLGSIFLAWHFDALGVLLFLACLLPAKPLLDVAYNATEFGVIDRLSQSTGRSLYAFLFHHEFGLLAGRAAGFVLFFLSMRWISADAALRVVLPVVTAVQLLSIPMMRRIERENPHSEALPDRSQAAGNL